MAAALACASLPAAATVLTGTVRSEGAQSILAPPSMTAPVTLRFYVPDGTHVKQGQPVLRIDASNASGQLQTLRDKITLTRATNAKELAALELKQIDARLALVNAKAALAKAEVDAAVPKNLITALDYDKYQGAFESARRDAALKRKDLAAAEAAVKRQRDDGALQIKKLKLELAFFQGEVDVATVYAEHDGVVVHGFQSNTMVINGNESGGRYREGSMTLPGTEVGQVVGADRRFSVLAWALQPDRGGLKVGQAVRVHFDALPKADIGGHIQAISDATQEKTEWGDGHYYRIDIALDKAAARLGLLPGMSARIETDVKADHKPSPDAVVPPSTLHATGEIIAQKSWTVSSPQIPGVWQLNITRMASDGSHVKKGQPLVTFAAGTLAQKMPQQQSELAEQKRTREQLRLKLADDKRTAELAVAKAKADADKARRKAQQPKETIPGIEYKKLVIDRHSTRQVLALTEKRAKVAAASRKAQMDEADAKVTQLQRKVTRMQQSMAKLTIRAPRDGLFLHRVKYDGSKLGSGDQVFFGLSVGSMPDMDSLAVSASLPERDLRRVHVGQAVRVVLSGGAGRTLDGHIARIGQNVHSKSGAEPIPVVSLQITLDKHERDLKPGRSVRVDIPPAPPAMEAST
ncbi:MAG TPA: HlyD family efflux transporter periplasmic adaptor subunit [Rhodanobacteraceae bacterium]|nr:HlyD family efflux transporter periplasmic adaptor subunit [Rhodanobacteraceae bacterium]